MIQDYVQINGYFYAMMAAKGVATDMLYFNAWVVAIAIATNSDTAHWGMDQLSWEKHQ